MNQLARLEQAHFAAADREYEEKQDREYDRQTRIDERAACFDQHGYMVRADGTVVDWRDIDEYVWDDASMDGDYEPDLDQKSAIECAQLVAIKRAALIEEAIQHFAGEE